MDNLDQQVQATKKEEEHIKELELVTKPTNHLAGPIVSPLTEQPIKPSEEHAIDQETTKEDQVIEVPHIDFIFGDSPSILEDRVQTMEIQNLMHLSVRLHSNARFRNQKKQRTHSPPKWKTRSKSRRLSQAFKSCIENKDQAQIRSSYG